MGPATQDNGINKDASVAAVEARLLENDGENSSEVVEGMPNNNDGTRLLGRVGRWSQAGQAAINGVAGVAEVEFRSRHKEPGSAATMVYRHHRRRGCDVIVPNILTAKRIDGLRGHEVTRPVCGSWW